VYLDQPHNGNILHQLGVATKPIPFQQLTAPKLLEALSSVLKSPQMRDKSKQVAAELKIDGVPTFCLNAFLFGLWSSLDNVKLQL